MTHSKEETQMKKKVSLRNNEYYQTQEMFDRLYAESKANKTHYEVGSKIRNTIKELGGTMPEDLPTPDKSLKELEKENKDLIIKK